MFDKKYRPRMLKAVIGQDAVVRSLTALLESEKDAPHSYLFSGPSGVGKTTLARIIAKEFKADVLEVDAATYSKIENIRELTTRVNYKPMSADALMIIVDECHALSKQAWEAFLKTIEEPPEHAYFAFCTTNLDKVPPTVVTRCAHFALKELRYDDLMDLIGYVCDEEHIQLSDAELGLIAKESRGSARQAVMYLQMCAECNSLDEIRSILSSAEGVPEAVELARALVKRARIDTMIKLVESLDKAGVEAESLRLIVLNYVTKVAYSSKGESLESAAAILEEFSTQCHRSEGYAPIVLAVCRLCL